MSPRREVQVSPRRAQSLCYGLPPLPSRACCYGTVASPSRAHRPLSSIFIRPNACACSSAHGSAATVMSAPAARWAATNSR